MYCLLGSSCSGLKRNVEETEPWVLVLYWKGNEKTPSVVQGAKRRSILLFLAFKSITPNIRSATKAKSLQLAGIDSFQVLVVSREWPVKTREDYLKQCLV